LFGVKLFTTHHFQAGHGRHAGPRNPRTRAPLSAPCDCSLSTPRGGARADRASPHLPDRIPGLSPWSQCFSRSYASILPTSLGPIAPLTRGCSPRSPDAVIGTAGSCWTVSATDSESDAQTRDLRWGFLKVSHQSAERRIRDAPLSRFVLGPRSANHAPQSSPIRAVLHLK